MVAIVYEEEDDDDDDEGDGFLPLELSWSSKSCALWAENESPELTT